MKMSVDANDKAGMTLDELTKFIEQCKAMDMTGDTQPNVSITVKGRIKKINAGT